MASQKYESPNSPPPYNTSVASPQPAHIQPTGNSVPQSEYYAASPYPQTSSPYPQQENMGYQQQPQGGYHAPGPQQGYGPPQGQYGGPQGGYYQPNGPVYQQQGYGPGPYGPQGGYYRDDRGMGGGSSGCMGALLGLTAACCCLDACLLF